MTRWDSVPSRWTFPVPARTTTRSMWRSIVVVVVRSCLKASLTPTEMPQTTSRTPKTSSTSLGVERAIGVIVQLNAFRWPGGHQASAGTAARTSAMAPGRLLASPTMLLSDYQRLSRRTATYPGAGENIVYPTLGLAGEAGEVAEKVKKMLRDDGGVMTGERLQALAGELGDVLWYVAQVATEAGLDLEEIAQANLDKLLSRQERGVLSGSGDSR